MTTINAALETLREHGYHYRYTEQTTQNDDGTSRDRLILDIRNDAWKTLTVLEAADADTIADLIATVLKSPDVNREWRCQRCQEWVEQSAGVDKATAHPSCYGPATIEAGE